MTGDPTRDTLNCRCCGEPAYPERTHVIRCDYCFVNCRIADGVHVPAGALESQTADEFVAPPLSSAELERLKRFMAQARGWTVVILGEEFEE